MPELFLVIIVHMFCYVITHCVYRCCTGCMLPILPLLQHVGVGKMSLWIMTAWLHSAGALHTVTVSSVMMLRPPGFYFAVLVVVPEYVEPCCSLFVEQCEQRLQNITISHLHWAVAAAVL